ncbi:hypothetical protein J2Y45_000486 [Dyadobacter sp. BE34]|uniref:Uncharacterized protein n=1 Tax=Dyadobacter fermentans TaxID=94254 RepID=A0ABU1QPY4_9BACT|nr:hypothetical protein [Dyadobacter fermentans]MDR7040957.1 hypothetical protein [Dyadobacter sp. BE242]MDR7195360.1 hypothetical protein [Dyadobacter sp. BE34]MDR7260767.1 hypothetical protein [Dyadobacter sp. BE32]
MLRLWVSRNKGMQHYSLVWVSKLGIKIRIRPVSFQVKKNPVSVIKFSLKIEISVR